MARTCLDCARHKRGRIWAGFAVIGLSLVSPAQAADITADAPTDLSVTIYRAPYRSGGSIDLNALGGFALVTETRTVRLPAGESRLRFEGVSDGIEAVSAIVTGLPSGVIEKNRDAKLLSPSALVAAALGKQVVIRRTDPAKGKAKLIAATIIGDADGGISFATSEGIEALRCSGLPETVRFEKAANGLSARPTLSVLTASGQPITARVTLSYLARGFDWAADYTATLAADGKTIDLGAWVTLANGNGVGFPSARTQVVAGKLNRSNGAIEPIDVGGPILATCWPRGSTSDTPEPITIEAATPLIMDQIMAKGEMALPPSPMVMMAPAAMARSAVSDSIVQQEELGDLKLYRVPDRTTVSARQSKQVRLLDRKAVPVEQIHGADFLVGIIYPPQPAKLILRTKNDAAHRLGLALPSGSVRIFAPARAMPMLIGEARLADRAVDEEVELSLGTRSEVQASQSCDADHGCTVEISNAGAKAAAFELRLALPDGAKIETADQALAEKNGRPIIRLAVPAGDGIVLHYRYQPARRPS